MTNSILEITESEYLIKLNRGNFNLSFIRSLLKMVEVANPSEEGDFVAAGREVILKLKDRHKQKRRPGFRNVYFFVW